MNRSQTARQLFHKRAQMAFPGLSLGEAISRYQKSIRAKVSSASCAANGAKGYKALVDAGKGDLAGKMAADYRFEHPSDLERIIIGCMQLIGKPIDRAHREVKIGRYYVDFKYGDIVIEANDDTWHTLDFHGEDRPAHDQGKYAYLRAQGHTVIILAEQVIRSGQAFRILSDVLSSLAEQEDF